MIREKNAWSTWFVQCIDIHTSTISFLKTAFVTSSRSQEFSNNFCVKRPPFFSNKKTPLRPVGSNPTDLMHLSWRSKFEKGKLWEWISPTKWSNKMDETTGTMATRNPVNSPVEVYIGSLSPLFIEFFTFQVVIPGFLNRQEYQMMIRSMSFLEYVGTTSPEQGSKLLADIPLNWLVHGDPYYWLGSIIPYVQPNQQGFKKPAQLMSSTQEKICKRQNWRLRLVNLQNQGEHVFVFFESTT